MKIAHIVCGIIIYGVSMGAFAANDACPAVDCDCAVIGDVSWRKLCEVHESAIARECSANKGKPQSYCRMHGPSGFPVAVSATPSHLDPSQIVEDEDQLNANQERVDIAVWSLQEDLDAALAFQVKEPLKASQVAKIIRDNAQQLFVLQQKTLAGWSKIAQKEKAISQALAYDKSWRALSARLSASSDLLKVASGTTANKQNALEYRLARLAATTMEYAGYLLAQVEQPKAAAVAWQQSASLAENLVTRAQVAQAPEKYVKYYREQAAARWHRATYYWLEGGSLNETQLSFQNAEQVLQERSDSSVAGTDVDPAVQVKQKASAVKAQYVDSKRDN